MNSCYLKLGLYHYESFRNLSHGSELIKFSSSNFNLFYHGNI